MPKRERQRVEKKKLAICEDSGSDRSARDEAAEPRFEEEVDSFFLSFLFRSLRMTDFMVELRACAFVNQTQVTRGTLEGACANNDICCNRPRQTSKFFVAAISRAA